MEIGALLPVPAYGGGTLTEILPLKFGPSLRSVTCTGIQLPSRKRESNPALTRNVGPPALAAWEAACTCVLREQNKNARIRAKQALMGTQTTARRGRLLLFNIMLSLSQRENIWSRIDKCLSQQVTILYCSIRNWFFKS